MTTGLRALSPLLAAGAAVLLVCPGPVFAETFEDETDVFEIQIPVVVTDRDGEPIRGLGREDFEVVERGRGSLEIVDFRVFDLERLRTTPGRVERTEDLVPAAARRHFLLLFDLSFSSPSSLAKARLAARDLILERLHPNDLVAVMTFSLHSGVGLVMTFTPDRAQLARAIDSVGRQAMIDRAALGDPLNFVVGPTGPGRAGVGETSSATESTPEIELESEGAAGSLAQAGREAADLAAEVVGREMERQETSYRRGHVAVWARSLKGLAEIIDSVAGRKQIVYFSEGFDGRLLMGDGARSQIEASDLEARVGRPVRPDPGELYGDTSLLREIHEVLTDIARSGSMIQAVDISSIGDGEGGSRRSNQDSLFYLANETGGALFTNRNDLAVGLRQIVEGSSVTYLLTVRPDEVDYDGSFHPIEIRADLPKGARLSYRKGYRAPEPFEELHPLEKNLLAAQGLAAAATLRDIPIDVLAAPFMVEPGKAYVPVVLEVDGRSLIAGHDREELPVEIYVYASDADGTMRDFFTQLVTIGMDQGRDALQKGGLKYYGHLDLSSAEHLVRVLVRNGATGRTGVANARVAVPGFAEGQPAAIGPFFPQTSTGWVMVRERQSVEGDRIVYPFTVNGEPYIPAARPELLPGEESRFCLVAYNLDDEPLRLEGTVLDERGEPLGPAEIVLEERTVTGIRGVDKLVASFRPVGLAPGEYELEVRVGEEESPFDATGSMPFRVVAGSPPSGG